MNQKIKKLVDGQGRKITKLFEEQKRNQKIKKSKKQEIKTKTRKQENKKIKKRKKPTPPLPRLQIRKDIVTLQGVRRGAGKKTKDRPNRITRAKSSLVLKKLEENPIISPNPQNDWESQQTFNPGVVLLDNKVYFLYRAIGEDGISRMGYAVSSDGITIDARLPYPVYEHKINDKKFGIFSYLSGGSWGGAEDPRIVRVGDEDLLYMTYTACDNGLRVGLTSITVDDFLKRKWRWGMPALISPPNEIHKNWVVFPEKINGQYAILHSIVPHIEIAYRNDLNFGVEDLIYSPRVFGVQKSNFDKSRWERWLRGTGAPPLKTKDGWLLFYHAMDNDWSKYKVGVLLLDLKDPTKILYRAKEPILEPEEFYENNGYKGGVVYLSGAIIKEGNLLVYYGCADNYVGVAYGNLNKFLATLKKEAKPKLKLKRLKKK